MKARTLLAWIYLDQQVDSSQEPEDPSTWARGDEDTDARGDEETRARGDDL